MRFCDVEWGTPSQLMSAGAGAKVGFLASGRPHGPGHFRPFERREFHVGYDRFQGTGDIAKRQPEGGDFSETAVQRNAARVAVGLRPNDCCPFA